MTTNLKNWKSENEGQAIYEELVMILQKRHPAISLRADRVASAEKFVRENAAKLVDFTHEQLHPDTCEMYRALARGLTAA